MVVTSSLLLSRVQREKRGKFELQRLRAWPRRKCASFVCFCAMHTKSFFFVCVCMFYVSTDQSSKERPSPFSVTFFFSFSNWCMYFSRCLGLATPGACAFVWHQGANERLWFVEFSSSPSSLFLFSHQIISFFFFFLFCFCFCFLFLFFVCFCFCFCFIFYSVSVLPRKQLATEAKGLHKLLCTSLIRQWIWTMNFYFSILFYFLLFLFFLPFFLFVCVFHSCVLVNLIGLVFSRRIPLTLTQSV